VRRVYNRIPTAVTSWSAIAGSMTVTPGATDPLGGNTAYTLTTSNINQFCAHTVSPNLAAGVQARASLWIRRRTGTGIVSMYNGGDASATTNITAAVTTSWQRIATNTVTAAGGGSNSLGIIVQVSGDAFDIWQGQLEEVNGSNQNPSEYVSVGVLASPYHGANVDGVKYFKTLNGNTVAANVVTEATGAQIPAGGIGQGWLPGLAGSYFSTPNAVANQFTTFVDIDVHATANDWTPAAPVIFCAKRSAAGAGTTAYVLYIANGAGTIGYIWSDGATAFTVLSNAPQTFTDYTAGRIRVLHDVVAGTVKFYTSVDGVTWVQLGTTVATTVAATIININTVLEIGSQNTGTNSPFPGTIYRVRAYTGNRDAGGTLAVDFDPQQWTTGGSFTSGGAVWTLNGGAKVLKYPIRRCTNEAAKTNLVLQSEDFGTTWGAVGTPTRVAAALRCGSVKLDLIGDDDAAGNEGYQQVITFTGDAVKAFSIYFAQGTSTTSAIRIQDSTAVADRLLFAITWTNGIPTATMTTGTLLGIDSLGNGVFRVRVLTTSVTAANTNNLRIGPAADISFTAALTGNVYMGGVQAENYDRGCSSYIPTTTATVTRNLDLLSYPIAGNINTAQGTCFARISMTQIQAGNPRALADSVNAIGPILMSSPSPTTSNPGIYDAVTFLQHGTAVNVDVETKVATCWGGAAATMKVTHDGLAIGGASFAFDGTVLGAGPNLNVGGITGLDGDIGDIKLWSSKFDDAPLVTLSNG
jgi:hypothetical protein